MLWISTIIALIIEVLSYLYFILHCWNSVDNHRATLIAFPGATASRWRKMVSGIRRCVKGDRLTGRSWYIFSLFAIFQRVFPVTDRFSMPGAGTGPTKGGKSGTYQVMPKIGAESTVEPEEGVLPLYKGEERKRYSSCHQLFYRSLLSNVVPRSFV